MTEAISYHEWHDPPVRPMGRVDFGGKMYEYAQWTSPVFRQGFGATELIAPWKSSGVELPVPAYAQNLHKGHFPEYGGGGENWCSPTATEMVVEHWGRRPRESQMSWIPDQYVDRTVDYAARNTYDYIWLRTKRYTEDDVVAGGTGGIAYIITP